MPHFTYGSSTLHYLEQGDGELLIVLPGNTSCAAAHEPQLGLLGELYRAAALDFLGTGRSDRADPWPRDWWAEGARQAMALMDHLGHDAARLMGTSGGAVVALHAAAAYPDRVDAVVADSFSLQFTPGMLQRNVVDQREDPANDQVEFWQFCHGDDWEQVVAADTAVVRRLVEDGGEWLDIELEAIACPVLLTGSRADPMILDIEADYRALEERIPDATRFLEDAGGHPFMWTRPERFHPEALAFLERVG